MCYDIDQLQQILDCSFEGDVQRALRHIESCPQCKSAFESLKAEESRITELLNFGMVLPSQDPARALMMARASAEAEIKTNENSEYVKFKNIRNITEVFRLNKGLRRFSAAAAGLMLCFGVFCCEPLRVKAQDLLQIFRMDNVQTISFSQSDIYELEDMMEKGKGSAQIQNFGTVDFESGSEPVNMESVSSADEIRAAMPAAVVANAPQGFKISSASFADNMRIKFSLDATKINEFLKYMGEENLLPESIGNKPFFVHTGSFLNYGLEAESDESDSSHKYISITQTETPEIEIPSDVDKNQLVSSLLSLRLIPENLKRQLLAIDDLTSTVPIIYSEEDETESEMTIRGQSAVVIEPKNNDNDYIRICFKEDGYMFFVDSYGVDKDSLIELIESME